MVYCVYYISCSELDGEKSKACEKTGVSSYYYRGAGGSSSSDLFYWEQALAVGCRADSEYAGDVPGAGTEL